jgi:hypothetical protein
MGVSLFAVPVLAPIDSGSTCRSPLFRRQTAKMTQWLLLLEADHLLQVKKAGT